MSAAAELSRSTANEPDRLEGFSVPREVDRVFGHGQAIQEFEDALHSRRMHHAWLLAGPEGVGKATLAYQFARALLLPVTDGVPQGLRLAPDHAVFRKVAAQSHPNLLVLRRSWIEKTKKYSQWIGVDEVRRLRAFLGSTPGETGYRVVIVDRADELNQNAANALLKALEEPPPRTVFLLITGAEGRLPVTIRSRARILRVGALAPADLESALRAALARDDHDVEDDALNVALSLSEGSVRRALELVSGEGIALYQEIMDLLAALPDLDAARLHRLIDKAAGDGERVELFFSLLLGVMERLVRFSATGEGATPEEQALAQRLIDHDTLSLWAQAWEAIGRARADAFALNLDRSLLLLETGQRLQQLAQAEGP
ncbi:MAG: DNA polymerase III subunit delta' [Methyloceanibacter sp.]|uniref:DNA polymerase III subunit delta' n=1 Tax=Methyloceanibacter sp. TaxID=1965321 RepID=UPI003D9B0562